MVYSIFAETLGPCINIPAIGTFCNVTIFDTLPAGFNFNVADIVANLYSPFNGTITPVTCLNPIGNDIVCDVGNTDVGDFVVINVPGTADPSLVNGTVLNNQAVLNVAGLVFFVFPFDEDFPSNIHSTTIIADPPEADLTIAKADAPDPIIGEPGNILTYTLVVANSGPNVANNVVVTDTLPATSTFDSASAGCTHDGSPMGGVVTCDILSLGVGAFEFITITVNPPVLDVDDNPIAILNIAQVSSDEVDSNPDNITFEPTQVFPPGLAETFSDLVISKIGPDTVIQGVPYVDTIFVTNNGNPLDPPGSTADNVSVTDIIPVGAEFLGSTSPGVTCDPPIVGPAVITCTVDAPMLVGDIVVIEIDMVYSGVLPPAPVPLPFPNIATAILGDSSLLDTIQIDPLPENNVAVKITNVVEPPPTVTTSDLVVTKSAPIVVIEDDLFEYEIEVANLGPDLAQNVILTDIIPASDTNPPDLTFSNLPTGCSVIDNAPPVSDTMECGLGDIAMNQVVTIVVTAQYTGPVPGLPDSEILINLATADFGFVSDDLVQIDPETSNNTDTSTTRIIAEPPAINLVDLFLVKIDSPDPVVTGTELTYTLFVYNFGITTAENVIVTDTLPAGVTNIVAPGCGISGNVVTCIIASIPGGGGFAPIQITVDAPALLPDEESRMILNAARADVDPFFLLSDNIIQLDYAPSNNTDSEKTTVVTVPPPLSDLLILKSDNPDPVIEGNTLTYTLFIKNGGPADAYGVEIFDWLPADGLLLDTVDWTLSNVDFCEHDPFGPDPTVLRCFIEVLPVDGTATVTVTVQTDELPPGLEFLTIFNVAKVESIGFGDNRASADPNPLNNMAVESTLIGEFVPTADLFILKSDSPDPVIANHILTYVLFVSNAGPDQATNVMVTDLLPDSVNLISAIPSQGTCGGLVGNLLTCNLGAIDVGQFAEVRIEVTPTIPGTILNVAQVMADEHDPVSSNNTAAQTTTVVPAPFEPPDPVDPSGNDLFVLKFVSPNPVEVGEEVLFTLILGNNGEFGSGATLVDDLPPGVTFISATANTGDPCNLVDGNVVCQIGTIPPLGQGQTVVVEVLVRVDQTGTIPNIAFLDDVPNDPNTTNNVSIVAVNVIPDTFTPQDPPDPQDPQDPQDGGTGGTTTNNGCAVAQGPISTSNTAINFALLLLPLIVFGIRSARRKK